MEIFIHAFCPKTKIVFSATFFGPDLSVALAPDQPIFYGPDLLYIFRRNCNFSRAVPDSSFPLWLQVTCQNSSFLFPSNLKNVSFCSKSFVQGIAASLCFISLCLHTTYYLANGILYIKQYFQIKTTNNLQHV